MRKRRISRRLVMAVLLFLALVVVVVRWSEAREVGRILWRCAPGLLLLAVLAEGGYFLAQAGVYQALCEGVGLFYAWSDLQALVILWPFVNVVVPAVGVSGIALLADDARQRDQEPERAVVASLAYMVFLYAPVGAVAWAGLAYLQQKGLLQAYHVLAAVVHALALAGMLLALGLAGWRPATLGRILGGLVRSGRRTVSKLLHRAPADGESDIESVVAAFHRAVRRAVRRPQSALSAAMWALAGQGASLLVLYLIVRSLGRQITPWPLAATYGVSTLVTLVSPTPQGVGFTEGAAAAMLHLLGEPMEVAVAISLAYRGVTFWMPFLIGSLLVRRLPSFREGWAEQGTGAAGEQPLPERRPPLETR